MEYHSINNVEHEFLFCLDDIECCVSGNKMRHVLDWCILPNTWPMYRYNVQSLKREGVGAGRHWVPIVAKGGSFSSPQAFYNCHTPNPLVTFLFATTPNFEVWKTVCLQPIGTGNKLPKTNGRAHGSWMVTMWLESLPFHKL